MKNKFFLFLLFLGLISVAISQSDDKNATTNESPSTVGKSKVNMLVGEYLKLKKEQVDLIGKTDECGNSMRSDINNKIKAIETNVAALGYLDQYLFSFKTNDLTFYGTLISGVLAVSGAVYFIYENLLDTSNDDEDDFDSEYEYEDEDDSLNSVNNKK